MSKVYEALTQDIDEGLKCEISLLQDRIVELQKTNDEITADNHKLHLILSEVKKLVGAK